MTVTFEIGGQEFVALNGNDADRSERVMEAVLTMGKIDVARLQQAYKHGS